MVVDKGWNKDDNNMKEDDQLESGSDEEFIKGLDMNILSGVNNSFRERKVPDSCMSGRQDGASEVMYFYEVITLWMMAVRRLLW